MNKTTIFSLVLNVVLAICLFFKSALNDILKEYWQIKYKRKHDRNQRIINLRKHLSTIRNYATSNLVSIAEWHNAEDPNKKAAYKERMVTSLKMSGDSYRLAREDMIYYPDEIKSALEKFMSEYQEFMEEILEKPIYKERLYEMSDYINSAIDNIIEMIDKQRLKLIS